MGWCVAVVSCLDRGGGRELACDESGQAMYDSDEEVNDGGVDL